jgi:hypothetical protein
MIENINSFNVFLSQLGSIYIIMDEKYKCTNFPYEYLCIPMYFFLKVLSHFLGSSLGEKIPKFMVNKWIYSLILFRISFHIRINFQPIHWCFIR